MKTNKFFVPGSIFWLARHQIRLSWRVGRIGKRGPVWMKPLVSLLFITLLSSIMGLGIALQFRSANGDFSLMEPMAGAVIMTLMIAGMSMNLMGSFMTITEKGDLDLLLSSPIPPERFVAARLISSAWRGFMIYAGFATIFFAASIITVSPMFASIYVVVAGFAVFDAAFTYLFARQALRWFGLRKGRNFTIAVGAIGVMLGLMAYQLLSNSGYIGRMQHQDTSTFLGKVALIVQTLTSNLSWLGRTVLGDWIGAAMFPIVGLLSFLAVLRFAGRRYDSDVAFLNGQDDHAPVRKRVHTGRRFGKSPLGNVVTKEWLSLIRDPLFISQLVVPLFTMIPFLGYVVGSINNPESNGMMAPIIGPLFAAITVFNLSMLTSSLAWLVASVEEARDLLQASPTSPRLVLQGKIIAASLPAFIELLIAAACLIVAWPVAALSVLVFGVATCSSACIIEFSRPRQTKRPRMTQRPDRSIVSVLLGLGLGILWAIAAGLAASKLFWWLIPAILALAITWLGWATRPKSLSVVPASVPLVEPILGAPGGPWQRVSQS